MSTDCLTPNPGWAAWRHNWDECLAAYLDDLIGDGRCRGEATHADPAACRGEDCDASLSYLGYEVDNLAPGAAREAEEDLQGFLTSCLSERPDCFDGITPAMVGHDFYMTRNGHGVGFWDRGLGERGHWLSKMSESYGDQCAYIGDDGLVYVHG